VGPGAGRRFEPDEGGRRRLAVRVRAAGRRCPGGVGRCSSRRQPGQPRRCGPGAQAWPGGIPGQPAERRALLVYLEPLLSQEMAALFAAAAQHLAGAGGRNPAARPVLAGGRGASGAVGGPGGGSAAPGLPGVAGGVDRVERPVQPVATTAASHVGARPVRLVAAGLAAAVEAAPVRAPAGSGGAMPTGGYAGVGLGGVGGGGAPQYA